MTKSAIVIVVVLVSLFFPVSAFSLALEELVVSSGLYAEGEPVGVSDRFNPVTPVIHAVAYFSGVDETVQVHGSYVSVDAISTPNYVIAEVAATLAPGTNTAKFELSKPNNDWPIGHYQFDLYVDGIPYDSLPFEITPAASASAPVMQQGASAQSPTAAPGGLLGQHSAASPSGTLVGFWNCEMQYNGSKVGNGVLSFDASGRMTLDQTMYRYQTLGGNVLRMSDQTAAYDYEYRVDAQSLQLRYSDGSSFACTRSAAGNANGPAMGAIGQAPGNDGNAWQLSGTYCSYNASGGYSSSQRIYFDGAGRWSTSREAYSTGSAGTYAGSSGGEGGQYQITGRTILYRTGSGEQGSAAITMQQNNGRITEITVSGTLYAQQLCD